MLDITKLQTYSDGTGYVWTFYGDDTNPHQYYLVPKIWFTQKNGHADFKLVEYKTDNNDSLDGYCRMQLEISASEVIQRNIKKEIAAKTGTQPIIQVLVDKQGNSILTCRIVENGHVQYRTEIPSYRAWTNSIVVFQHLNAAEIVLFKNALSKGGEGVLFHYPLTVESRLIGTDCKIDFNIGQVVKNLIDKGMIENILETSLNICSGFYQAYDRLSSGFEQATHVSPSSLQSDVTDLIHRWGQQRIRHHIYSHIKEVNLQAEQADCVYFNQTGEDDILPLIFNTSVGNTQNLIRKSSLRNSEAILSDTLKDLFFKTEKEIMRTYKKNEEWVSSILNKQINNRLYKYSGNLQELVLGIESIKSFNIHFKESQVIPWGVDIETRIGSEDLAGDWDNIYTISKEKKFTLNVMADLSFEKIERVEVIVRYPGLSPAESRCILTAPNKSYLYSCPLVITVGNQYQLSFLVHYCDKIPPLLVIYPSGATASSVTIKNQDIGLLQVNFYANYIDYQNAVNFVTVHFFFKDITGTEDPFVQEFTLRESSPEITVQSLRARPINNKYEYTVTYHLKNGTVYAVDTETSNGENVYLFGPPNPIDLGILLNGRNISVIDQVVLDVYYFDAQNKKVNRNIILTPHAYYTSIEVYSDQGSRVPVYYSGTIQYKGSSPDQVIEQTVITSSLIVIDPDYRFFSVKLDSSSIQWTSQLTLMQANLTPFNPVNKTSITESFQFSPRSKRDVFWGFYTSISSKPQYIWNGTYFFTNWVSLQLPKIPDQSAALTLPDTPSADEMYSLIMETLNHSSPLSPPDMIQALLVAPYLPCEIAPVIHKHYPKENLGALLKTILGLQNCCNTYLGVLTFALREAGFGQKDIIDRVKTIYSQNWSSAYETTIKTIYQSESLNEIKALIDKKIPSSKASIQVKQQFSLQVERMAEELSAAYSLIKNKISYEKLAISLEKAGYTLAETSEACKNCYQPNWDIDLYNAILDQFRYNQTITLTQAAFGYSGAGFLALESAPALYQRFLAPDSVSMAVALINAWPHTNTLQLQESLQACCDDAGQGVYTSEQIDEALLKTFPPHNCGDSLSGQFDKFIKPNEYLSSQNNHYELVYQLDGNLVLLKKNNTILWQSHTGGKPAWRTYMQSDGNFVIYQGSQQAVWASNSAGNPQSTILLQDDGNLVIMNRLSKSIWATNTRQIAPKGSGTNLGSCLLGDHNRFFAPNDYLMSDNNEYSLIYHTNGNLVLYNHSGAVCWQTNTQGRSAWRTYMQPDGNFVVYQGYHQPIWASNTDQNWNYSKLELTNEGIIQIYGNKRNIIWKKNDQ